MPIHDFKCTNDNCGYLLQEIRVDGTMSVICPTCQQPMVVYWPSVKTANYVKGFNAANSYGIRAVSIHISEPTRPY